MEIRKKSISNRMLIRKSRSMIINCLMNKLRPIIF